MAALPPLPPSKPKFFGVDERIGGMDTPGDTPRQRILHTSDAFFRNFINVWQVFSVLLCTYTYVWEPDSLYAGVVCLVCGLVAKVLQHHGKSVLIRWLFISPFFVLLLVAPWMVNGIRTPLLMHSMLLLIFSGWMLGTRVMWVFFTCLITSVVAMWGVEKYGLWQMPQELRGTDMYLIALLFSLSVTTITVTVLLRNYQVDILRETTWQQRLQQSLQFNALIIDSSPVPIRVFGPQGQCVAVNEAYATLFDTPRTVLLAENLRHSALANAALTAQCLQVLQSGQALSVELQTTNGKGQQLWLGLHVVPFERAGERHVLAHLVDLTEHRRATLELQQMAFHDSLTGLANRRLFWEHFQHTQQLCMRNQIWGGVLLLDLNRFKALNDTHGHEAGDQMLQEVARRLQDTVRASDVIARLGGDEFTLLVQDLGDNEAQACAHVQRLCEKLHHVLSQPYYLGAIVHHASASIGCALLDPHQDSDLDTLLHAADAQMYAHKKQQALTTDRQTAG